MLTFRDEASMLRAVSSILARPMIVPAIAISLARAVSVRATRAKRMKTEDEMRYRVIQGATDESALLALDADWV